VRSFINCALPQISVADEGKEDGVGGAGGMRGSGEKSVQSFGGKA
jgi:hypothetical protein